MAVSALELRPRAAVALFDAALRLCRRAPPGVWALTLPGGARSPSPLLHYLDASPRTAGPGARALWLTAAPGSSAAPLPGRRLPLRWSSCWWRRRARAPGARCLAALQRLPSLFIATVVLACVSTACALGFTLGIGSSSSRRAPRRLRRDDAGPGQRLGAVRATCSTAARARARTASAVRLAAARAQSLVVAQPPPRRATLLTWAASSSGSTSPSPSASPRSTTPPGGCPWSRSTFTLFEPLRAAAATLLLMDGRVRQEGLDLLAALEQLPRARRSPAQARRAALASCARARRLLSARRSGGPGGRGGGSARELASARRSSPTATWNSRAERLRGEADAAAPRPAAAPEPRGAADEQLTAAAQPRRAARPTTTRSATTPPTARLHAGADAERWRRVRAGRHAGPEPPPAAPSDILARPEFQAAARAREGQAKVEDQCRRGAAGGGRFCDGWDEWLKELVRAARPPSAAARDTCLAPCEGRGGGQRAGGRSWWPRCLALAWLVLRLAAGARGARSRRRHVVSAAARPAATR